MTWRPVHHTALLATSGLAIAAAACSDGGGANEAPPATDDFGELFVLALGSSTHYVAAYEVTRVQADGTRICSSVEITRDGSEEQVAARTTGSNCPGSSSGPGLPAWLDPSFASFVEAVRADQTVREEAGRTIAGAETRCFVIEGGEPTGTVCATADTGILAAADLRSRGAAVTLEALSIDASAGNGESSSTELAEVVGLLRLGLADPFQVEYRDEGSPIRRIHARSAGREAVWLAIDGTGVAAHIFDGEQRYECGRAAEGQPPMCDGEAGSRAGRAGAVPYYDSVKLPTGILRWLFREPVRVTETAEREIGGHEARCFHASGPHAYGEPRQMNLDFCLDAERGLLLFTSIDGQPPPSEATKVFDEVDDRLFRPPFPVKEDDQP